MSDPTGQHPNPPDDGQSDSGQADGFQPGPAGPIIERFGGIRPLAAKLGVPVSTVQGWKKRGHFPASRRAELVAAAAQHGVALSESELEASLSADGGAETAVDAEIVSEPARAWSAPGQPAPGLAAAEAPRMSAASAPAAAPAVTVRRRGGFLAFLALLLALAALGLVALPYVRPDLAARLAVRPEPAPAPAPGEVAELRGKLDELAGRLADLEIQVASRPVDSGPSEAARTALTNFAQRLEALEQAAGAPSGEGGDAGAQLAPQLASLAQRLDRLDDRVGALAETLSETQTEIARLGRTQQDIAGRTDQLSQSASNADRQQHRSEALALAAGQLEAAVASGRPFADRLATLHALVGEDAELQAALAALGPHAEQGLAGEAVLQSRFRELAPLALAAERRRPDASWWQQALDRLSTVIVVRRIAPDANATGSEAVLARAGALLDRGDIEAALAETRKLTGAAAQVMAGWLDDAQARVDAREAAAKIAARAVATLAAPSAP